MCRNSKGFSFLELLIVIATIVVLVAVLIPNIVVSRQRALDAQTQACLKEIATVQSVYYISEGAYAADVETLSTFPQRVCNRVELTPGTIDAFTFEYSGSHEGSDKVYRIAANQGVQLVE